LSLRGESAGPAPLSSLAGRQGKPPRAVRGRL